MATLKNYIDDQMLGYGNFQTASIEQAEKAVDYLGERFVITEIATGYRVATKVSKGINDRSA